jgi:hypothetical protein
VLTLAWETVYRCHLYHVERYLREILITRIAPISPQCLAFECAALHARRSARRALSQKTIGGCWERQSEEDENIDPGARCHCVDAPAAQLTAPAASQRQSHVPNRRPAIEARSGSAPFVPHRLAMLPNVIFEPQTSGGVYNPKSPKNSSMRYFNVSYHKNLLRLRAYCSPTSRLMSSRSSASSACQGNKLYEAGVGSSQKVRDPAQGRVPRSCIPQLTP